MAKKGTPKPVKSAQQTQPIAEQLPTQQPTGMKWSLYEFNTQAIIIALLGFIFYVNSFYNEYAHDDGIVILKNEYVLEGFSGIPDILTKDAYDSYYRQLNTVNQLSGGRYRPLSIVTFAIEQQFLGAIPKDKLDSVLKQNIAYGVRGDQEQKVISNMHVRHAVNVLIYILSAIVLLYFLRNIVFKNDPIIAFIAALIFTIHPIHTEVVANVKSRDEIMSLLFMCLTFIYAFKYQADKNIKTLGWALLFYLCAFLSKEYAITMIALLPLALYLFNNYSIEKSIKAFLPFVGVIVLYLALRYNTMGEVGENSAEEVLNNPYLFASPGEKLATEIATCLNYIRLLIFPHPLSADYSYNSIPYKDFGNPLVWLSFAIHAALVYLMFALIKKRSVLGFALAFYLLHFALVCNIIFDIGATMGERLVYHSSVGFAIIVAWLLVKGAEKMKPVGNGYKVLTGFMIVVIILCGIKTIDRNADWKNDGTLFAADLSTVPNSVLVLGNVAASYITKADNESEEKIKQDYLHRSIELLNHAISIHPTFVAGFLNRGIAWYKLGNMDNAKANLDSVKTLYPSYPTLPGMYKLISDYYMKEGWNKYGKAGKYPELIVEFRKAITIDPGNAELWYDLGGALYSNKQYDEAIASWQKTLQLNPNHQQARNGMQAVMAEMNGGKPPATAPAQK